MVLPAPVLTANVVSDSLLVMAIYKEWIYVRVNNLGLAWLNRLSVCHDVRWDRVVSALSTFVLLS